MASTIYQNVCKYIYQDPNPKVQHLPFTVNQWWNGNCLRIYKTEIVQSCTNYRSPSAGPLFQGPQGRQPHSQVGAPKREMVRRGPMEMLAPASGPTPIPPGVYRDISRVPKDRTRAKHVAEPEARRQRCFPHLSSKQEEVDFPPYFPSPFLLPVTSSFSLCLSPTHSFLTAAPVSTQTAWESPALLWKDYFPIAPGLQKTIISITIPRSFDYVPDTFQVLSIL